MAQNIKDYLLKIEIDGNIILYRDKQHKKKAMCEYLAQNIKTDKLICVQSGGAFGLYIAKAFPNNKIIIFGRPTIDYLQQINALDNAIISSTDISELAKSENCYFVNQYDESLIEEYSKNHFSDIIKEVGNIDAFCDCSHSCATMAGAIASGMDCEFIMGVVGKAGQRTNFHYLNDRQDKFIQETTKNFDTKQIQADIEAMYPDFGNIFEATRSISAAMSWLQKNPGKTVLVYVGDSPVFGEDATID